MMLYVKCHFCISATQLFWNMLTVDGRGEWRKSYSHNFVIDGGGDKEGHTKVDCGGCLWPCFPLSTVPGLSQSWRAFEISKRRSTRVEKGRRCWPILVILVVNPHQINPLSSLYLVCLKSATNASEQTVTVQRRLISAKKPAIWSFPMPSIYLLKVTTTSMATGEAYWCGQGWCVMPRVLGHFVWIRHVIIWVTGGHGQCWFPALQLSIFFFKKIAADVAWNFRLPPSIFLGAWLSCMWTVRFYSKFNFAKRVGASHFWSIDWWYSFNIAVIFLLSDLFVLTLFSARHQDSLF